MSYESIRIEFRLDILPGNRVAVPGCEPLSGGSTALQQRYSQQCPCAYADLADVLAAIPQARVEFGSNWGQSGWRKKWLVLPPSPQECCLPYEDWYALLRTLCRDDFELEERYESCSVVGQGFCPTPGYDRVEKPPFDPYLPEGTTPFGPGITLGPWVPPWQIPGEPTVGPDPTNPTTITNPTVGTDPTESTNPSEATNPVEPTNPTDLTNPTSPTNPEEPTNPSIPFVYTLDGPAYGVVGVPTTPYTITPTTPYTGTVLLTDGGALGTFTPSSLTWTGGAEPQQFTYTAAQPGIRTVSAANSYGLLDVLSARTVSVRDKGLFITSGRGSTWSDPHAWWPQPGPAPDGWGGAQPPPGDGDSVVISVPMTVDGDITIGKSVPGQTAATISANLEIPPGTSLTLRGNVVQSNNITVTGTGNGRIRFDSTATTPTTTNYTWKIGTNAYAIDRFAKFTVAGTDQSEFTIESVAGGGNGFFINGGAQGSGWFEATYCRMERIGDSVNHAIQSFILRRLVKLVLDHCTIVECGEIGPGAAAVNQRGAHEGGTASVTNCAIINQVSQYGLYFSNSPAVPTLGVITGNDFGGQVYLASTGFTISGNTHRTNWLLNNAQQQASTGTIPPTFVAVTGPSSVQLGQQVQLTASLRPAGTVAQANTTVSLSDPSGGVVSPSSAVIPAGQSSAQFGYTASRTGAFRVGATTTLRTPKSDGHAYISSLSVVATAPALTYVLEHPIPSIGLLGVESDEFVVSLPKGTNTDTPVVITPDDDDAGGTFNPASVTIGGVGGPSSAPFRYTAAESDRLMAMRGSWSHRRPLRGFVLRDESAGSRSIRVSNNRGLADPQQATFTVVQPVTSYQRSAPASGEVRRRTPITITLGAGALEGTVRVLMSVTGGDGSVTPSYIDLTNGNRSATFFYSPSEYGPKTITFSNNRGLSNPAPLQFLAKVQTGSSGHAIAGNRGPDLGNFTPFDASQWWRDIARDVRNDEVDPLSDSLMLGLAGAFIHVDGSTTTMNGGNSIYGTPYNVVDGNTPLIDVAGDAYANQSDQGKAPIRSDVTVQGFNIPSGVPPAIKTGGDQHLLVYVRDEDTGGIKDLWELFFTYSPDGGATWRGNSTAHFPISTGALRRDGWTTADAAGLPIAPLIVTYQEILRGEINHPLRVTFGPYRNSRTVLRNKYIWPARHTSYAGGTFDGIPYGAVLRMSEAWYNANKANFTGIPRIFIEAMRKYGLINADVGGFMYIQTENDERWEMQGENGLLKLQTIPATAFEIVKMVGHMEWSGPTTVQSGVQSQPFTLRHRWDADTNFGYTAYFYWTTDVTLPESQRVWKSSGITPGTAPISSSIRSIDVRFKPPAPGKYMLRCAPSSCDWLPAYYQLTAT